MRKLINWLTLRTAAGELFDIDTALRPNGNSGLLVTSLASFENYQTGRGSNTAWTWEHQALTRARWCAGCARLAPRFEAVRRAVLRAPRDRRRCAPRCGRCARRCARRIRCKAGRFDVKHSAGRHDGRRVRGAVPRARATARAHPELLDDVGNIALLQSRRGGRAAAGEASARPRPTPTANCAAPSTRRASTSSRRRSSPSWLAAAAAAPSLALWRAVVRLTRPARRGARSPAVLARRRGASASAVEPARRSTGSRRSRCANPGARSRRGLRPLQRAAPARANLGRRAARRRARARRRACRHAVAAPGCSPGR